MAPSFGRGEAVGFAWGLIGFAWVTLILTGPLGLFLTWYGDCFSQTCPSATALDGAIYRLDVAAVAAIAVIAAIAFVRPSRVWFALIALMGVAFTAEAIAGLLGYRGLYAFGILLPAGVLATIGGIAGIRALDDRPLPGMGGPAAAAVGVGCAAFAVPVLVLLVLSTIASGTSDSWLLALALLAAVVLAVVAAVAARRRRRSDLARANPGPPAGPA